MVLVCYSGIKENACNIFTQKSKTLLSFVS
jgi:hypothetical protein